MIEYETEPHYVLGYMAGSIEGALEDFDADPERAKVSLRRALDKYERMQSARVQS